MRFMVNGDEEIAAFEQQHVELIVSDVLMPGMDGGQLLNVVKQRWPTTVRIIVSGYSDPVQAVRLTSLAHQYVAKPCDGRELENIIERCFNLQHLLSQEPLNRVVGGIGKLPAMPKTYGRLQEALSQPTVTADLERMRISDRAFSRRRCGSCSRARARRHELPKGALIFAFFGVRLT